MKKILIVAEYFAPNNEIGAVRATKLAKHFKLKGYYIGVVSRKMRANESIDTILLKNLKYVDEHIIVSESWLMQKTFWFYNKLRNSNVRKGVTNKTTVKSPKNNLSNILFSLLRKLFTNSYPFYAAKSYSRKAKKQIGRVCHQYDVVLTSCSPFSANILGRYAKITNPNIRWIADFRDPLRIDFRLQKHLPYYNWIQNEVIKRADAITGVSDFCIENFKDGFKGKIIAICNGFDEDDISNINVVSSEKFSLTYAGTLYGGKRDLSIVFKAINELIIESKINKYNIVINYLGNDVFSFLQQTDAYDLLDVCKIFGKVDREKSLQLQLNSHILLLASWNNIGNTGIITGKYLEYMMINKPIICSIMGNLPNSVLKEMIIAANNGVVWEQANDEFDYPIMKEYILKQYQQYEKGLSLIFAPNREYINRFRYEEIANRFIEIIEKDSEN